MLDKENVRQWLIREKGFSGHGPLPVIPEDVRRPDVRAVPARLRRDHRHAADARRGRRRGSHRRRTYRCTVTSEARAHLCATLGHSPAEMGEKDPLIPDTVRQHGLSLEANPAEPRDLNSGPPIASRGSVGFRRSPVDARCHHQSRCGSPPRAHLPGVRHPLHVPLPLGARHPADHDLPRRGESALVAAQACARASAPNTRPKMSSTWRRCSSGEKQAAISSGVIPFASSWS